MIIKTVVESTYWLILAMQTHSEALLTGNELFKCNFQCFGHEQQNSIQLHSRADILKTITSQNLDKQIKVCLHG